MKIINMNDTMYQIIQHYPELQSIFYDLGFTDMTKPGMLQTVGRFMTLKQGSQLKKIPRDTIINVLETKGFTLKEDGHE